MNKNFLNKILEEASKLKASDIHICSSLQPCVRVNGDIKTLSNFEVLTKETVLEILLSILTKNIEKRFIKELQIDFAYFNHENNSRYRVNAFKDHNGVSIVLRALNNNIPTLENFGYPDIFKKIASLKKGLVLVCGPTGSGKSTTLASMVDYVNRISERHIVTIEDPIEYVYKGKNSLINQREVGRDVLSFADGLKGALRQDPDVILIGEMRDRETIKMALTAAETGHLVFGTLHTMSASKTIDRIIDSVDTGEKEVVKSILSTSLKAIVLQTLLKKKDGNGRIAAFEILIGTTAIRNMIRENKIYQIDSMIQTGSKYGMVTMKEYIQRLANANLIDRNEAESRLSSLDE